jgi:hypothetical protein
MGQRKKPRPFQQPILQLRQTLFRQISRQIPPPPHSTVTDLARLRGLSTSVPLAQAV